MVRQVIICFLLCFVVQTVEAEDWKRVYLAAFPRSGNHWIRYLIEEATNIATSSVYCDSDPPHLIEPFPWGGYSPKQGYEGTSRYAERGEVVVIKTHYPFLPKYTFDSQPHVKTFRIVRHPVDSIYSLYLCKHSGNPPSRFIEKQYLRRIIARWRTFQEHWNEEANVFTIRYEDLYENPYFVLNEVLKRIGYRVGREDIQRAIAKYPPEGGILRHLVDYPSEDIDLINAELKDLMEQFGYDKITIKQR